MVELRLLGGLHWVMVGENMEHSALELEAGHYLVQNLVLMVESHMLVLQLARDCSRGRDWTVHNLKQLLWLASARLD